MICQPINVMAIARHQVQDIHLLLLQRLSIYVSPESPRDFFDTPRISHQRPFGNSDVCSDVGEICGIPRPNNRTGTKEEWAAYVTHAKRCIADATITLDIMLSRKGDVQAGSWYSYTGTENGVSQWEKVP